MSLEHKPSMTFCSHFSWLSLGANCVTCFWFLTFARPKSIAITDDDVLIRLCEIVSCAWKVAEGKLRQPPLRSAAVSQVFFFMWVAEQLPASFGPCVHCGWHMAERLAALRRELIKFKLFFGVHWLSEYICEYDKFPCHVPAKTTCCLTSLSF